MLLMVGAILCELAIGLTMGLVAAAKRGSTTDQALMLTSFVGVSAPQFVVGPLLLYVFAVQLGWFPIGQLRPSPLDPNVRSCLFTPEAARPLSAPKQTQYRDFTANLTRFTGLPRPFP
jgi:ABC-type dipeptide/oligopeptide/nickel transport system permease component